MTPERSAIDQSALFSHCSLSGEDCVIAAVSGGSDSTALLLMLKAHLDAHGKAPRLLAVTVDHGLRPESADEARQVGALCASRRIDHLTLRWQGDKPGRGLSAAAREARYLLLAGAARENGAHIVFTGHTLDDQVETVAMRQARGDTHGDGRGLAGIAPATLYAGDVWMARPLLACRRADLRQFLTALGVGWIDDPSNDSAAFERVRVRAGLRLQDARAGELAALAKKAAAARIVAGEAAAATIRTHARMVSPGLVFVAFGFAVDRPAALYALRLLLAVLGGREQLPDAGRAAALLDRVGGESRATLSRVAVDVRPYGLYLHRELRGLPEIPAMEGARWDGRFTIEGFPPDARVAAIGRANAAALLDETEAVPRGLAVAALAAEPGLWREGAFLGPLFGDGGTTTAHRLTGPFARFLPSFDLAPARALAALLGARQTPAPPWRGHIGGDA